MSEFEQTLLFASTGVVILGTLVVFVVRFLRGRGRDD